jgi:hypothetical protein
MSDDDVRFERMLERVTKAMPDEETAASIAKSFRGHWDKPPMELLEKVLRRTPSIEDARRILFLPEAEDMADYVLAFSKRPPGCPPTHPLSKLQPLFLGSLYMVHREDEKLMRTFVVKHGGLRALSGLLADENLYVVSQALDTIYSITALFDWHADPPDDLPLLQSMADLAGPNVGFVRALEGCYENRFPGCSMRALSVLAFWLGIVRYFFCKERVLRLGADVLGLLQRWSKRTDCADEEKELAAKLFDDFSRFPLDKGANSDSSLTAERPANLALNPSEHRAEPQPPLVDAATEPRARTADVEGDVSTCLIAADQPTAPCKAHGPIAVAVEGSADKEPQPVEWQSEVLDDLD